MTTAANVTAGLVWRLDLQGNGRQDQTSLVLVYPRSKQSQNARLLYSKKGKIKE